MSERRHLSWRDAMHEALYGEAGFYLAPGSPGRHFRTSAHASAQWAEAIRTLAGRVDAALGEPEAVDVVDIGAGGGELLAALAERAPLRWRLHGVDVAPRPPDLPGRVSWSHEPPTTVHGLLLANEVLDVVPVDVVEQTAAGPRLIEVTRAGEERLADPPEPDDEKWLRQWWPLTEPGDRAEIGRPRDAVWHGLVRRVERGVAVAIDYAAVPERDVAGTLAGYRDGRQVAPVPDGSCDVTAHVCFESMCTPGDVITTQREALGDLGISGARPSYDGDPAAYLSALSAAGDAAELTDPSGLGGFTWLVHPVGVPAPIAKR